MSEKSYRKEYLAYFGCISECSCCKCHEWEVKLYEVYQGKKILVDWRNVECGEYFSFKVHYDGSYLLSVCPSKHGRKSDKCKPVISLKNVGVGNFIIE